VVSRRALPRALAALCLLALGGARAAAEATVGVKLRILESLSRVAEADWALLTLGTARVSASATSENVKAELAVDALVGEGIVSSVARASVAVRFPGFRLTLGKARLSWGEGVAFNAADLLFGAGSALALDLTADSLRDDAAWMAALTVPLGRFSFLEAVALPPPLDVAGLLANPLAPLPEPADVAAGGRVVGKLAGIKVEAAYLYRGDTATHAVATSLQGNLLVDWHLSARMEIPSLGTPDLGGESFRVSAGLFHRQRLGQRASLSLRLEALVCPAGSWAELEPSSPPDPPPVYGLLLYPELALALGQAVSVTARALISPVDGSALLAPAVALSLHKGLTFLGMASVALGDSTDTFAWDRRGGLSFTAGCAYSY